MKVSASEFKAKCLALIDQVEAGGEAIVITKRGRVVATLVAPQTDAQPWFALRRSTAKWHGDPFAPAIASTDVAAFK